MTDRDYYLLWLDLETTGSNEAIDCIIEIGCMLTTPDLQRVPNPGGPTSGWWEFESLVEPSAEALHSMFWNPIVWQMHTDNGLIEALQSASRTNNGPSYVAARLVNELTEVVGNNDKVMLAGSGVGHFDLRFLRKYMPSLTRRLMYPVLDVGVLRRSWKMWGGTPAPFKKEDKTHRALDDAILHYHEARHYRSEITRLYNQAAALVDELGHPISESHYEKDI